MCDRILAAKVLDANSFVICSDSDRSQNQRSTSYSTPENERGFTLSTKKVAGPTLERTLLRYSTYGWSLSLRFSRIVAISEGNIVIFVAKNLKLIASYYLPTDALPRKHVKSSLLDSFLNLQMLADFFFLVSYQVGVSGSNEPLVVNVAVYISVHNLETLSKVANITVPYGRNTDPLAPKRSFSCSRWKNWNLWICRMLLMPPRRAARERKTVSLGS